MIANHMYEEPAPLPRVTGMPVEIGALIGHCLAKDPTLRPRAIDVARKLMAAAGVDLVLADPSGHATREITLRHLSPLLDHDASRLTAGAAERSPRQPTSVDPVTSDAAPETWQEDNLQEWWWLAR